MKAVIIEEYGAPDAFKLTDVPMPKIKKNEVLVKVFVTTVVGSDIKVRKGLMRSFSGHKRPDPRVLMGLEFSGEIVSCGSEVSRHKKGNKVFGMMNIWKGARTYAEYVAVPEKYLWLKPENVSHEEASALPVGLLTTIKTLNEICKIERGQHVLVNGASGGVGVYAIQVAKNSGAVVTAVCGGASAEFIKGLGADFLINYSDKDFTREKREKYDVVFDVNNNKSFSECRKVIKSKGIYVTTNPYKDLSGYIKSVFSSKRSAYLMVPHGSIKGLQQAKEMVERGIIKPVIDKVFEMEQVEDAHRYYEGGSRKGRIVLRIVK